MLLFGDRKFTAHFVNVIINKLNDYAFIGLDFVFYLFDTFDFRITFKYVSQSINFLLKLDLVITVLKVPLVLQFCILFF